MGIPRFYRWLIKSDKYEKDKKGQKFQILHRHLNDVIMHTLSIDMNGLIHTAAQKTFLYDKHETKPDHRKQILLEQLSMDERIYQFLSQITDDLDKLLRVVRPQVLIMCVDGVAPIAKVKQQRLRRYKSTITGKRRLFNGFDPNSITPGTEVMRRIDTHLRLWMQRKSLPIHYSSYLEPGEGEHKIFTLMKHTNIYTEAEKHFVSNRTKDRPFAVTKTGGHMIFGLDADLTMLSLLSPLDNIILAREHIRGYNSDRSDLVYIDNLRHSIEARIGKNRAIDFIVAMFFSGNDFFPRLPYALDPEVFPDLLIMCLARSKIPIVRYKSMDERRANRQARDEESRGDMSDENIKDRSRSRSNNKNNSKSRNSDNQDSDDENKSTRKRKSATKSKPKSKTPDSENDTDSDEDVGIKVPSDREEDIKEVEDIDPENNYRHIKDVNDIYIDFDGLKAFVDQMCLSEKTHVTHQARSPPKFPFKAIEKATQVTSALDTNKIDLDYDKFKDLWYEPEYLPPFTDTQTEFSNDDKIFDICNQVLLGIQWNLQYYISNGRNVQRWYYPFNIMPLMCDMKRYLDGIEKEAKLDEDKTLPLLEYEDEHPIQQIHQLLLVIYYSDIL